MNKFTTPQQIAADIAREYREDNSRWTQHTFAKNAEGRAIFELAPEAVCFCLAGAINKRTQSTNPSANELAYETYAAFDSAISAGDRLGEFVHWNDKPGRTVQEVIELCEKVANS